MTALMTDKLTTDETIAAYNTCKGGGMSVPLSASIIFLARKDCWPCICLISREQSLNDVE